MGEDGEKKFFAVPNYPEKSGEWGRGKRGPSEPSSRGWGRTKTKRGKEGSTVSIRSGYGSCTHHPVRMDVLHVLLTTRGTRSGGG